MKIIDIINEQPKTRGKIPWHEPEFSQRMLAQHLSQAHNWASRRLEIITAQSAWLEKHLPPAPARILDLGCGPGLYTHLLAEKGYHCLGVDYSPASIAYARQRADAARLDIAYLQEDILRFKPGERFDCILFLFAEFNTFKRQQAHALLRNCAAWLKDDGFLLLEAQTWQGVEQQGTQADTWQALNQGLFCVKPHICLQQNTWQPPLAHSSYYIIEAASQEVTAYGSTTLAYSSEQYAQMFAKTGFTNVLELNDEQWPVGDDFKGQIVSYLLKISGTLFYKKRVPDLPKNF